MQPTGNPFVDTGLAVIAHLVRKNSIEDLGFADIRQLVGDGSELATDNSRLKTFTMVFGTNGPLTQPAYRKSAQNVPIYKSLMRRLVDAAAEDGSGPPCELAGIPTHFDFQKAYLEAMQECGQTAPPGKWIGRDSVPLAGSLGNDAQALPAASRPMHVSATALLALQYLPLALFLFQGKLACYQSTYAPLVQQLIADQVEENSNRLRAGNLEIYGKGQGSSTILNILLRRFEDIFAHHEKSFLPPDTALYLWLFSNSGTDADCSIQLVPDPALRFLWEAVLMGFHHEIREMVKTDPSNPRFQFFTAIRNGEDYAGLYPKKKWLGASQKFYEFYQTRICGFSGNALYAAGTVGRLAISELPPKRLKELRKPEAFRKPPYPSEVRRVIVENLSLASYDALFPSTRHPISSDPKGWNLIRFYVAQDQIEDTVVSEGESMRTTHPKIELISSEYFRSLGPNKVKGVLDRLARRKIGIRWLQDVFCSMAQQHREFELGDWDEFVCDDEGRPAPFELLFQMRLALANLYREATSKTIEVNS